MLQDKIEQDNQITKATLTDYESTVNQYYSSLYARFLRIYRANVWTGLNRKQHHETCDGAELQLFSLRRKISTVQRQRWRQSSMRWIRTATNHSAGRKWRKCTSL